MTESQSDRMPPGPSDEWLSDTHRAGLPAAVCDAYAVLSGSFEIRRLGGGLLHQSFHIRTTRGEYVLQRVSDAFAPEIQDNIRAVTSHLARRGVPTPTLIATTSGGATAELGALGRWRLMPHLGGVSFRRPRSPQQAESAGALVGRFHAALDDFEAPLAPMGIPYRDTPRYLAALREALDAGADHPLAARAAPIGRRVIDAFDQLGPPAPMPERVIHGDLKLENLLFEAAEGPGADRAFALVDLDTLMRAPLWVELGDAWRSWCNPARTDEDVADFDLTIFEASFRGYRTGLGRVPSEAELASLVTAPERLALELCARFVTDAYDESYFAWDARRFARSGEHQLARAEGQWTFYQAATRTRADRESILSRLANEPG